MANSQQFFERQVSQLHAKLTDAQKELQNLKDTTGISDLLEQRSVMVNAIGMLERNIAEAEAEQVAADRKDRGDTATYWRQSLKPSPLRKSRAFPIMART